MNENCKPVFPLCQNQFHMRMQSNLYQQVINFSERKQMYERPARLYFPLAYRSLVELEGCEKNNCGNRCTSISGQPKAGERL
jgi:hypothetical protein